MVERVAHRVALDGLRQRQRLGAVRALDREELVDAAVADRRGELPRRQRDVLGIGAVPVEHGGHVAGTTRAARTALAELGTRFGLDTDLGHDRHTFHSS